MAEEKSLLQKALDLRAEWASERPALGAQMQAMGREAAKDINSTLHQVFFGQQTGPGEPGTPLVPTQAQVSQDLGNVYGHHAMLEDAATRPPSKSTEREQGRER